MKGGGSLSAGEAYISFLIQSGANLAQTFTNVQKRQKRKQIPHFLAILNVILTREGYS